MLSYVVSGDPHHPAVIATHGVTDCAASLTDLSERLSSRFQVFSIDTLGHGDSPRLTAEDLLDPFGAALDALRETVIEINAQRADRQAVPSPLIGIGHSMGGALLSALADIDPYLFQLVILEDPAWLSTDQSRGYHDDAVAARHSIEGMRANPEAALKSIMNEYPSWPASEYAGWLQGKMRVDLALRESGVVTFDEPWESLASRLSVRTVVVTSDGPDTLVDPDAVRNIGNEFISVRHLPGARHCIRREDPEAFDAMLAEVLESYVDPVAANPDAEATAPYIRPELEHVIADTPAQTTSHPDLMRSAGEELLSSGTQLEKAQMPQVTNSGTRIFDTPIATHTLFAIHGGAYIAGSAKYNDCQNAELRDLGFRVVAPEYRLAPEDPYPAAVEDCERELAELSGPVVLFGDSAGAGLAWTIAARGNVKVDGLILLEPCIDPLIAARSYTRWSKAPVFTRQAAVPAWEHYRGTTPTVSEALRSVHRIPATFVVVNPSDPLRDEGIQLAKDLADAGAVVELHMPSGTFHGSLSAPGPVWEELKALIGRFVSELGQNSRSS